MMFLILGYGWIVLFEKKISVIRQLMAFMGISRQDAYSLSIILHYGRIRYQHWMPEYL